MAYRRSNAFNADVNQDLLSLIEGFDYAPYTVQATSGYRPGDKRQHGRGNALDLELIDPKTGQRLGNYQDPSTFGAYQQYANALYQHALQTNPELAQKLRWGGYFSGGKGKYGALDLMHFDTAGQEIGMGGGSWEGGLTPEQAQIWGLQAGGGLGSQGGGGQQPSAAAAPSDPHQAFVAKMWPLAVAQSQRTGVDPRIIMAQTIQETGWGESAPNNNYFGIKSSHENVGGPQKTLEFINGKMTPVEANFRGYKDPSESFADYGKFINENPRYQALREAKGLEAQAAALQASGYATDPNYGASVLSIAQGLPEGGYGGTGTYSDSPSESAGGPGAGAAATPAATADASTGKWDKIGEAISTGVGGFADMKSAPMGAGGKAPQMPASIPATFDPVPITAPGQEEARRQLAEMMYARLKSGQLGA